jgi:hypothetical protein
MPVRVKKTRQNKNLECGSDSIKTALQCGKAGSYASQSRISASAAGAACT